MLLVGKCAVTCTSKAPPALHTEWDVGAARLGLGGCSRISKPVGPMTSAATAVGRQCCHPWTGPREVPPTTGTLCPDIWRPLVLPGRPLQFTVQRPPRDGTDQRRGPASIGSVFFQPCLWWHTCTLGRGRCQWHLPVVAGGGYLLPIQCRARGLAAPAYLFADPAADNAPPTARLASMLCHGRRGRRAAENRGFGEAESRPWEETRTARFQTLGELDALVTQGSGCSTLASWPGGDHPCAIDCDGHRAFGSWKDRMERAPTVLRT